MLRLLVLLLLVANAGFWAWRHGWLDDTTGMRATGDREPARLARQVEPQRVQVLSAGSAAASGAASPAVGVCLEVGPFDATQLAPASAALQTVLSQDRIEDVRQEYGAVWIVFIGPLNDAEARRRKVEELRRLKVVADEIRGVPELGDGYALGRFDTRAAAERALTDVTTRGVTNARIAQHVPPTVTHTLRIRDVRPPVQAQLAALPSTAFAGRTLGPCVR